MRGKPVVAVLGATGEVGREMLGILGERNFPLGELRLLASARSAGTTLCGLPVREAEDAAFAGCDLVLGAAQNAVARRFRPAIAASGAVFVDNSSAFRLDRDVPLVIPEINGADAAQHRGVIANPNCSTIVALMAVWPLHRAAGVTRMVAATYQAVSGAGAGGPAELMAQVRALERGETAPPRVFAQPIAYNVLPQIGAFDSSGYTAEEMKMQNEGRKILHAPDLLVSCACVRVPVMRSHSVALSLETARPLSPDDARAAVAAAPGLRLVDDPAAMAYPTPLAASGQDLVLVGRIRKDPLWGERGLSLFCCGDQVRKGAATNAVQIAELLL